MVCKTSLFTLHRITRRLHPISHDNVPFISSASASVDVLLNSLNGLQPRALVLSLFAEVDRWLWVFMCRVGSVMVKELLLHFVTCISLFILTGLLISPETTWDVALHRSTLTTLPGVGCFYSGSLMHYRPSLLMSNKVYILLVVVPTECYCCAGLLQPKVLLIVRDSRENCNFVTRMNRKWLKFIAFYYGWLVGDKESRLAKVGCKCATYCTLAAARHCQRFGG